MKKTLPFFKSSRKAWTIPEAFGLIGGPCLETLILDRSFANWLIAVKCYQPHNAKLAAYHISAITQS
jgi:hypothetical protein